MERGEDGDYHVISETNFSERKQKANVRRNEANKSRIERLNARRNASVATNGQKRVGSVSGGITGNKKGLVILVNFSDKSMVSSHTQSVFNNQFNKEGYSDGGHVGSVHDYFYDQSYGQFNLTFDVIGPVTVSQKMSYYGGNDSNGDDMYPATMVSEAINLVDSQVNFADYDWDGDGEVDQVYVIYAGNGEAAGGGSNTIWPHEWNLSSAAYYGDGSGALRLDGVKINTYACSCELSGSSGTTLNGIGTACHEFSHCLGYPDFYDTDYNGGFGMNSWDLMDAGSYNGPNGYGEVPAGFTSYERWCAGWLTPTELTNPKTVKEMKPLLDSPEAYIIYNDKNENEYILLENRQNEKWFKYVDTYTTPHGLLAIHVDYSASAWTNNTPNNTSTHQRMSIIPASGTYGTLQSDNGQKYYYCIESQFKGHLFSGSGTKTSLTGKSNASSGGKWFTACSTGSTTLNHEVTEINNAADGSISFKFDGGEAEDDGSRYTVTLIAGTGTCSTTTWTQTEFMQTLTMPTVTPPNSDWTFIGWGEKEYAEESSTKPTGLYANGSAYLPTKDITLYAVYKKTGSGNGGSYTLDYSAESSLQSKTLGYGNAIEYTATDGGKWVIKAYKNGGLQINNKKDASIKVPECPGNISNIVVTDGTARIISFSATDYTGSNTPEVVATSASSKTATLDLSQSNLNTGYIFTTDGYTVITKIVVNYGSSATYYTYPGSDGLITPTISFASAKQSILMGDTNDTFSANVTGSTGEVSYTSSDVDVATVGPKTGRVVAKGIGKTTITATVAAVDGVSKSASATYELTVSMPVLSSIAVTTPPTKTSYTEGDRFNKDGMVVTATYANGYKREVEGYTLEPSTSVALELTDTEILVSYTEGEVTVTTTVPITVAPLPTYSVTFNVGSGTCETNSLEEPSYQSGIVLPSAKGVNEEWVFVGWATKNIEETDTRPTLLTAGSTYNPTANTTLYAVYCYSETTGGTGNYELVTEDLDDWSGDYVIAYYSTIMADGRFGGKDGIGKAQSHVSPGDNLTGNTIATEWGDTYHITLESIEGGYVMMTQDGLYNYRTTNSNGLDTNTDISVAKDYPITITFNSENDIDLMCSKTAFHYNSAKGSNGEMFRFYQNGGMDNIYLYKKNGSLVSSTYATSPSGNALAEPTITFAETENITMLVGNTYTNNITVTNSNGAVSFKSSNTSIAKVDATSGLVTAVGKGNVTITAYVDAVRGESTKASASYDISISMPELTGIAIETPSTTNTFDEGSAFTSAGLTLKATYANGYTRVISEGFTTSPAEGDALSLNNKTVTVSYTEGEVTKTTTYEITVNELPKYAVTFMINGHEEVVSQMVANTGVTPPTVDDVNDYTFVGWSTTDVTEEGTSKPTMVTLTDGKYTPKSPTTLYAVYKREKGQFAEGFTLDLTYNDVEYAVSTHDSKNGFTSTASNKLTLYYNYDEQKQKGYLWYKTGTNTPNYVYNSVSTTADVKSTDTKSNVLTSWTMTENDGVVILQSSTGRYLALNATDNSKPIRAYWNSTKTGQDYPHDWNITYTGEKFSLGSTSYYTSHPTTTIISVATLIDSIKNGENKTVEDVQKVVDKVLNK